jgi:hypothetical protein
LLQLADSFLQGSLSFAIAAQVCSTILFLPVVEKTGGNLVAPADLSRSANSAEELFNDLAFEFGTE